MVLISLRSPFLVSVAVLYCIVYQCGLVVFDPTLFVSERTGANNDSPRNLVPNRMLLEITSPKPGTSSSLGEIRHPQPPRLLLGIFTTNSEHETNRRKLIRKTYLSHYKILEDANLGSEPTETICSLTDLIEASKSTSSTTMEACRIVYTFVMGAYSSNNKTAPTDLTDGEHGDIPYIVDRSDSSDYERDVIYLNIQENLNEGKTATWFKYGSSSTFGDLGVDLIFKVDSDSVVVPRALLQNLNSDLKNKYNIQRPARNVYGGIGEVRKRGKEEVPYMQGGFYFLSPDVASHIFSSACPRADIITETVLDRGYSRSEDREVGNFVSRCWNNTRPPGEQRERASSSPATTSASTMVETVFVSHRTTAAHSRGYKDANAFRVKWKEYLSTDIALLRRWHIQEKYQSTNGCPPTLTAIEEEINWFDQRENMMQARQHFARFLKKSCGAADTFLRVVETPRVRRRTRSRSNTELKI